MKEIRNVIWPNKGARHTTTQNITPHVCCVTGGQSDARSWPWFANKIRGSITVKHSSTECDYNARINTPGPVIGNRVRRRKSELQRRTFIEVIRPDTARMTMWREERILAHPCHVSPSVNGVCATVLFAHCADHIRCLRVLLLVYILFCVRDACDAIVHNGVMTSTSWRTRRVWPEFTSG